MVLKRLFQVVIKLVQQFPQLGLRRQTAKKSFLYLYERSKQIGYLLLHNVCCFLDTSRFNYSWTVTGIERAVYSANGLFFVKELGSDLVRGCLYFPNCRQGFFSETQGA